MILVASKMDAANPEKLAKLRRFAKRKKLPFYEISSVTGAGLEELKWAMANEEVRRGEQPELPQQPNRAESRAVTKTRGQSS